MIQCAALIPHPAPMSGHLGKHHGKEESFRGMTSIVNLDKICIKMVHSLKVQEKNKLLSLREVLGQVMYVAMKVNVKGTMVASYVWSYQEYQGPAKEDAVSERSHPKTVEMWGSLGPVECVSYIHCVSQILDMKIQSLMFYLLRSYFVSFLYFLVIVYFLLLFESII